jgi:ankyrin repeat protein
LTSLQNAPTACEQPILDLFVALAQTDTRCRFRWVYCQVVYLRGCQPGRIRHALAELPDTLDETYERSLREINKADSELAHRLFQCVAVASRPLRVEELAEFLAFDFTVGPVPKFHENWRPEDPLEAVLSTCTTLLSLVNVEDSQVIQFSHFSVKEFITSSRFAKKQDTISCLYHVSMTPAHTLVTQACLGILLHLDAHVARDTLQNYPLAEYAAERWFEHARFDGVSQSVEEGMKLLFDAGELHFATWVWINEPNQRWRRGERSERPLSPNGVPLHYAAFCGLNTVVELLAIEHPQDMQSRGLIDHSTPLHLASQQGNVEVARILVEYGSDVSAENKEGSTPLHLVSLSGSIELARLLVKHGADVSAKNKRMSTPLHMASRYGSVDLARFLVQYGADISAQEVDRWTALHWASYNGHLALARFLVEHGADVSAKDENGRTAVICSSKHGHVDITRILFEHGADISIKDKRGWSALHSASHYGHVRLVRFLVEHGVDVSALSAQDESGSTLLEIASTRGYVDIVHFLVEHGADVSAKNTIPLHFASNTGNVDLVRFLVEHGADVSAKDKEGSTPLHWVSYRGDMNLARFLIEYGADVSAKNKEGSTPLHVASARGHADFTRFLVEHGADVSAKDKKGSTPLHGASREGHVELAQFFIEHGADATTQSTT